MPLFFEAAPPVMLRQPQEFSNLIGKAEPFRTGRGKAAGRLRDPWRLSCRADELASKLDAALEFRANRWKQRLWTLTFVLCTLSLVL
jgi:hypothetical protein